VGVSSGGRTVGGEQGKGQGHGGASGGEARLSGGGRVLHCYGGQLVRRWWRPMPMRGVRLGLGRCWRYMGWPSWSALGAGKIKVRGEGSNRITWA
jgi:hypothetical protein